MTHLRDRDSQRCAELPLKGAEPLSHYVAFCGLRARDFDALARVEVLAQRDGFCWEFDKSGNIKEKP